MPLKAAKFPPWQTHLPWHDKYYFHPAEGDDTVPLITTPYSYYRSNLPILKFVKVALGLCVRTESCVNIMNF
jgi:hypothetical protein